MANTATSIYTAVYWIHYLSKIASYDTLIYFYSLVDIPYFNIILTVVMMIVYMFVSLKLYSMIVRLVWTSVKFYLRVVLHITF